MSTGKPINGWVGLPIAMLVTIAVVMLVTWLVPQAPVVPRQPSDFWTQEEGVAVYPSSLNPEGTNSVTVRAEFDTDPIPVKGFSLAITIHNTEHWFVDTWHLDAPGMQQLPPEVVVMGYVCLPTDMSDETLPYTMAWTCKAESEESKVANATVTGLLINCDSTATKVVAELFTFDYEKKYTAEATCN